MILSEVKRSKNRLEITDVSKLNIQSYGKCNNYPQEILKVAGSSTNAKNCLRQYSKFIRGNGFKDMSFYKSVINFKSQTCDTLLRLSSDDLSKFGGFALHVNYNLLGKIVSVEHIPFENCRLGIEDDSGYVANIAVFSNWENNRSKKRFKKPSLDNIDYIDVFNPNLDIIYSQIIAAGGIEAYKGQILYVSSGGEMEYPTPIYDSAITDISTDEGLSNVRYRAVRCNFMPLGMLVYRIAQKNLDEDEKGDLTEGGSYQSGFDPRSFIEYQDDLEAFNMIAAGVERDEDVPKFIEFPTKTLDKDFSVTNETTIASIYSAFNQDVFYRIRTGALGFSSQIMSDAFMFYNAITSDERVLIEESFRSVFSLFVDNINKTQDYSIIPLTYEVQSI